MLVHMTPNEVNSLQGLAMAHGGSLTINPHTGLPEAGWLGKLLPTILGAAGMAFGIPPIWMGALGAVGGTAATGSLKKGLMAGLGAYGGASLAGAAGVGGALGHVGEGLHLAGSGAAVMHPTAAVAQNAIDKAAALGSNATMTSAPNAAFQRAAAMTAKPTGFMSGFGQAAGAGLPGGIVGKVAPMVAAQGALGGISRAVTPSGGAAGPEGQIDNSYQGPYYAQDRQQIMDPNGPVTSKQRRFFAVDMPEIRNTMGQVVQPGSHTTRGTQIMQPVLNPKAKKGQPMYDFVPTTYMGGVDSNDPNDPYSASYAGYAHGGEVQLSDGAFVLDARTVSEIGNGSSNAGMEALRRIGGHPVQGPGDGVSDSVPARIGKHQPARVARDEVIMPADVVRRIGKGDAKRGADKLYALMDKAHKARKKAGRGQDTKLVRGLA
jgi:hypothetical protein